MSKITIFCIEECKRQNDLNVSSVSGMVEAYYFFLNYSLQENFELNTYILKELAKKIKPQNKIGYRKTPVTFSNGTMGLKHSLIDRAIENLLNATQDITPEEFYIELEKIHPFEDGNGRLGAILYNWLNGTIYNPVVPPKFFE